MNTKKLYIGTLMAMGLMACSQEAPFDENYPEGTGRVLTSSLSLEVKTDRPVTRVNADGIPDAKDFAVKFFDKENTSSPVKTYDSYGSMPEVVVLPAGDYFIEVSYGEAYGSAGETAGFNKPHYAGKSDDFTVEENKITDNINPIIGKPVNVRVGVDFDHSLVAAMSPDSKVTVHVGEAGGTSLTFDVNTTEDGYFEYAENSNTLAATFIGEIEGEKVSEIKTFNNVQAGNYYRITFRLHYTDPNEPGNIVPGDGTGDNGLKVDATVTYVDSNNTDFGDGDIEVKDDEDIYLEDDMRPENGDTPNIDDPTPDDPKDPDHGDDTDPTPGEDDLTVAVNPPGMIQLGEEGINHYEDIDECTLEVKCSSGISKFLIKVYSEESDGLNLAIQHVFNGGIDLVNKPDNGYWDDVLIPLGVQVGLGGQTEVSFILSNFFPFVADAFDNQTTQFTIEIGDKNGNEEVIIMNVTFPEKH